jgi:two-component system phosphate regulon response regulator PhoB
MLPEMSGLEVCRVLKKERSTSQIPIIMLTGKAEVVDRIVGLELGADDYLTKPFSPRELVLRVKSVLRRANGSQGFSDKITLGGITIDRVRYEITVEGKAGCFTPMEFKLLTFLVERRGQVQSRGTLLNGVWGYDHMSDTRTVDTHIRRLREKLGASGDCIETISGVGYRASEPAGR